MCDLIAIFFIRGIAFLFEPCYNLLIGNEVLPRKTGTAVWLMTSANFAGDIGFFVSVCPRKEILMSFLTSIAIFTLSALLLGSALQRLRLPPLIGMLLVGILMGPYVLDLISPDLLAISSDMRQFALIVILARAGLSLDLAELKKVGRPAVLLCFLPACFEIVGYVVLSKLFLDISYAEGALMGAVMAAVSPAVVVPRMLRLQEEGYGVRKGIPQMITAGASCDDVFVIVLFTALLGMNKTGAFNYSVLWRVPASVITGAVIGALAGWFLSLILSHIKIRETVKVIVLLSVSFLLVAAENAISDIIPFSGLLAVISLCIMLRFRQEGAAERLAARFNKLWVFAEILLFVLVGAQTDVSYALTAGARLLPVVLLALVFRMLGVFVCLARTALNFKERLFCAVAYLPKATVQAAIGGIALSQGLSCGKMILSCAVLAILVTAPVGAFLTDITYKKLLSKE